MTGMAEVLAAHGYSERIRMLDGLFDGGEPRYTCRCGAELGAGWPSHVAAHQAAMLAAAGFGPAKEARAVALEEAADGWQAYIRAMNWGTTRPIDWLRARAAAVRCEG